MKRLFKFLRSIGSGDANTTGPGNGSKRHWSDFGPPPPPPAPAAKRPPFDDEGCRNYDTATTFEIVKAIEFLRREEGDSVTILCDNPDFNGQPNNYIECCCDWTDWQLLTFSGNTLPEALQAAVMFKRSKL